MGVAAGHMGDSMGVAPGHMGDSMGPAPAFGKLPSRKQSQGRFSDTSGNIVYTLVLFFLRSSHPTQPRAAAGEPESSFEKETYLPVGVDEEQQYVTVDGGGPCAAHPRSLLVRLEMPATEPRERRRGRSSGPFCAVEPQRFEGVPGELHVQGTVTTSILTRAICEQAYKRATGTSGANDDAAGMYTRLHPNQWLRLPLYPQHPRQLSVCHTGEENKARTWRQPRQECRIEALVCRRE